MKSRSHSLNPTGRRILSTLGSHLKLARLRRRFSGQVVAERAGISLATLRRLENGAPEVSLGVLLQVMLVMGLEEEMAALAKDDQLGRKIQDAQLVVNKRAPKRKQEREDV